MAESIVSFVVERITGLLFDDAKFLSNVPDKVRDLHKNLVEMLCLLKDADTKQEEDTVVRNWVSEIRDIAYDAEDVIENYILKVTSTKDPKTFANYFSPKNCVCIQVHKVGSEIERLTSRITDLIRKMIEHGITHTTTPSESTMISAMKIKEYNHVEETYIGMEDHINEVVGELIDETKQHCVVSLWGMGGLGKTSLARKIYMDKRVGDHFEYFAWACVSKHYQVESTLREILKNLDPKKGEAATDTELHQSLYKILQEKRCLVILDDIWTNGAWDNLKAAFPVEKTLSKILITTRNREIARYMDPHSFICNLRCLTEEESWELLKSRAHFDTNGPTSQGMEDIGRKIITQCGYLPLAIIVIGGVLAYKTTMEEWELVHQNIDLHLQRGNNEVLELSYNDLPYHLKPFFLYMGNFQEDTWISTRNLIRMWIAEGFVTNHENMMSIFDVAENYVNELLDRGMVQAREKKLGRKVGYIRLHDLMRDLSIRKAIKENFSVNTTMDGSNSPVKLSTLQNCKMRRLSMNMKTYPHARVQCGLQSIPHLRTLMCVLYGDFRSRNERFPVDQVLKNFRFLRVLDMVAVSEQAVIISESIGELIHLRHFRLVNFETKRFPSTIGNLVLLETFDIKKCRVSNSSSIPNVLWKLKRLREICLPDPFWISDSKSSEKLRLDCLENLEIFENFSFKLCEARDVQKFTKLRKLTFYSREGKKCEGFGIFSLLNSIKLKNLHHVSLKFYTKVGEPYPETKLQDLAVYNGSCKLFLGGRIPGVLPVFPPLMKKLDLYMSELKEDPMEVLEKLPNLVSLCLSQDSFVGREMVCSGGFPKLTSLTLFCLENLEEMKFVEGTMPCLSHLEITKCDKLKMVPQGLDFISRHRKLEFTYIDRDQQRFQVLEEEQGWVYRRGQYMPN